jgi:hypothetical protein
MAFRQGFMRSLGDCFFTANKSTLSLQEIQANGWLCVNILRYLCV